MKQKQANLLAAIVVVAGVAFLYGIYRQHRARQESRTFPQSSWTVNYK